MALTLAQLRLIAKHALGGGSPAVIVTDADTTLDMLINQAGEQLVALHPWQWLMAPPSTLNFTADQAYVALPSDFGEMVEVAYNDSLRCFHWVTPQELAVRRGRAIQWDGAYHGAVFWPGQTVVTANAGAPRLELHPTPASSVTGALRLVYRRGWTVLDTATDVANVPLWIEPLLVELINAWAGGAENEPERQALLAGVRGGVTFDAAVRRDGGGQTDFGPIRGGAAERAAMSERWLEDGTVSDPS
jgi:hypothetical protein